MASHECVAIARWYVIWLVSAIIAIDAVRRAHRILPSLQDSGACASRAVLNPSRSTSGASAALQLAAVGEGDADGEREVVGDGERER